MSTLYSQCHRQLQDRYEFRRLADRLEQIIVHSTFTEADIAFITSRDFFFLSTVDPDGHPTVSYKGGASGFVSVYNNALVFPCFDGNGMFLSMGNIEANAKVGLLFIDFEKPNRLRVQGSARLVEGSEIETVPGAVLMARVEPIQIFVNCPRYIHRYARVETSEYVPDEQGAAPLPNWKRLEMVHDALSPKDQAAVKEAGFIGLADLEAKSPTGED